MENLFVECTIKEDFIFARKKDFCISLEVSGKNGNVAL